MVKILKLNFYYQWRLWCFRWVVSY